MPPNHAPTRGGQADQGEESNLALSPYYVFFFFSPAGRGKKIVVIVVAAELLPCPRSPLFPELYTFLFSLRDAFSFSP